MSDVHKIATPNGYVRFVPEARYLAEISAAQTRIGELEAQLAAKENELSCEFWDSRCNQYKKLLETEKENSAYWIKNTANHQLAVRELVSLLREIEPHLDAIVCYASTTSEHPPNALPARVRQALASFDGIARSG